MTVFRPCIDLHEGQVKQIVGGTLTGDAAALRTNFVSTRPSTWFAARYREDGLEGGHVIQLGPGNREAALAALRAYPGGLQLGGGVTAENASGFLDAGASHVIVTSYVFTDERFDWEKLRHLVKKVGRRRLVLDLSCRLSGGEWVVAMNRWQTLTDVTIREEVLDQLSGYCDEFLIHAADVEGLCRGIDEELVSLLGGWGRLPVTYAGGARDISDLSRVAELSGGAVDLAIGSALDIFGGTKIRYEECVAFNRRNV